VCGSVVENAARLAERAGLAQIAQDEMGRDAVVARQFRGCGGKWLTVAHDAHLEHGDGPDGRWHDADEACRSLDKARAQTGLDGYGVFDADDANRVANLALVTIPRLNGMGFSARPS